MSINRLEEWLFILFCGLLTWLDIKFFPLPGAFVRPASLLPMFLGVLLIAIRIAFRQKVHLEVLINLLPWCLLMVIITILSFFIYPHAELQIKERTRLVSCLRESLGIITVISCFTYCGHHLHHYEQLRSKIYRALDIGIYLSLFVGLVQIGWFFLHIPIFQWIGESVQFLFLYRGQTGKVHGLTPEGSMYADLCLTIILPVLLARVLYARQNAQPWRLHAFLMTLAVLTLLGTSSRPGLIDLVIVLLFGGALTAKKLVRGLIRLASTATLLAMALALMLSIPQYSTILQASFANLTDIEAAYTSETWSNVTRASTQIAAYNILLKYPLGIGLGQYMFFAREQMPEWAFLSPEIQAMFGNYNTGSPYCDIIDCTAVYADPKNMILRIGLDWSPITMLAACLVWCKLTVKLLILVRKRGGLDETFLFYSLLSMPILCVSVSSYMWAHWIFVLTFAYYITKSPRAKEVKVIAHEMTIRNH